MRSKFKNMDKFLFVLMLAFTIFGLIMVFSASSMTAVLQYGQKESYFFIKQLVYVIVAYILGFVILFIPYKWIRLLKKSYKIISLCTIGILLLTIFCGETINGVTSWLRIGPVQLQPSEFAKTAVILFLAFSFSNKKNIFNNYKFLMPFVSGIICVALIAAQPDFGTAMILGVICFFLFLSIPLKDSNYKKMKIVSGVLVIFAVILFIFGGEILKTTNILNEEQISRLTYSNPCTRYSEKTGYQVCNAYIAINNGGLFGTGLGNSTQKYLYLPEAYTDFIFPIIVEELGSVAGALVIVGFLVMLFRIIKIAKESNDLSGSMIAYGTFALIVAHLLINLLGVLAIIPLTGVPLPLLSCGGSFIINVIVLLFMTQRTCIESKNRTLRKELENL